MILFRPNLESWLLIVIIIFAAVLRFYRLTSLPPGPNADELSFGYDAYSLLHTGREQWGSPFPLTFKSFGEYKTPLYGYLSILPVAVFGLNIFAIRFTGAFLGTLSVFIIFLLSKKLIPQKYFSLVPAFLLAISPWSVQISRGAFESGLMNFFIPAAIYFFFLGLKKNHFSYLSFILFGFSLYTYHSAKIIIPVILMILIIINIKNINYKKLLFPVLIFLIFTAGIVYSLGIGGGNRIVERSITHNAAGQFPTQRLEAINNGMHPALARLLHNRYQQITVDFISNYSQYFSSRFLLTHGAAETYYGMIPGIGVIYVFDTILLFGLLFFRSKNIFKILPLILWLLIAPVAAALSTGEGFSAHRAVGMLVPLTLLSAFGALGWYKLLNKYSPLLLKILSVGLAILIIINTSTFFKKYFVLDHPESARQMQSVNLEVFNWLSANKGKHQVLVSRSLGEPQIFIAFANRWDPADYQKHSSGWNLKTWNVAWVDQLPEYNLGKYTIKSIDWENDLAIEKTIIVARSEEFPKNLTPDKIFNNIYIKTTTN